MLRSLCSGPRTDPPEGPIRTIETDKTPKGAGSPNAIEREPPRPGTARNGSSTLLWRLRRNVAATRITPLIRTVAAHDL